MDVIHIFARSHIEYHWRCFKIHASTFVLIVAFVKNNTYQYLKGQNIQNINVMIYLKLKFWLSFFPSNLVIQRSLHGLKFFHFAKVLKWHQQKGKFSKMKGCSFCHAMINFSKPRVRKLISIHGNLILVELNAGQLMIILIFNFICKTWELTIS